MARILAAASLKALVSCSVVADTAIPFHFDWVNTYIGLLTLKPKHLSFGVWTPEWITFEISKTSFYLIVEYLDKFGQATKIMMLKNTLSAKAVAGCGQRKFASLTLQKEFHFGGFKGTRRL